jgi:uncharacterized protein YqfB (UPF0267 family)
MLKINNIDKSSPYAFIQDDIIDNITIENITTETVVVKLENICIREQNKIQFIGSNIVLDIKNCLFKNITTIADVSNIFLNYTNQNITITNFADILENNIKISSCCFEHMTADNNILSDIAATNIDLTAQESNIGLTTNNFDLTTTNFDLTTTFNLHSRPLSKRFIYLNFLGHTLSGNSLWYTYPPPLFTDSPHVTPPFGGEPTMSDTNKTKIQYIWRAVSDAFSIWDVDVTTEKPSDTELATVRNNNINSKYGVQCVIGVSSNVNQEYDGAGGIAFVNSFGIEPVFVFTDRFENNQKTIAYATSHEVGHSLGLNHKGFITSPSVDNYYAGHGPWGPIMGDSRNRPVNQWSKGEYTNTNNTVDEIAQISTYLTPIADDFSDVFANATYIKNTDTIGGIINSKDDIDTFKLILDANAITITASVASLLPTLKVGMNLYNNSYSLVAANEIRQATSLTGNMDASIVYNAPAGIYYLKIFGVGGNGYDNSGNPLTSFNDYGSIGNYKITGAWIDKTITPLNDIKVTIQNKIYDASTNATIIDISSATLGSGYTISATANFTNKNIGNNKPVTITGITLSGPDPGNYTIISPTDVSANITPKELTITGTTANNKIYNRSTNAILTGSVLSGKITGDSVTLVNGTGTFNTRQIGTNKPVTVTGFTLSGIDAGNYTLLSQPTDISANITAKALTITGITATKIYDGSTNAILMGSELSGVIPGDMVTLDQVSETGSFASKQVGINKIVTVAGGFTLSGADKDNYTLTQLTSIISDIVPRSLTFTGITANNKVYDGSTNAILVGSVLTGKIEGDDVSINPISVRGSFDSALVGMNRQVTITGVALTGADKDNYTFEQQSIDVRANITRKPLTITGTTANKPYDGTTTATLSGSLLSGVIQGDSITLNTTNTRGSFASKQAANNKPVTITGLFTISGSKASNYTLTTLTSISANITPRQLTLTGTRANNKIYDRTTTATLTGSVVSGIIARDRVTVNTSSARGTFNTINAGTNKPVTVTGFTLSGTDAVNYTITQPIGVTATITPKPLTLTGTRANNKIYDSNTNASLTGTVLKGVISGDSVSFVNGIGRFNTKQAGNNIPVTVTGFALNGAAANNYTILSQPTRLKANITKKTLTITGTTANNKIYDGNKNVTLNTNGSQLSGLVGGDTVIFDKTSAKGTFLNNSVGTNKPVKIVLFKISGNNAVNYTLLQPTNVVANITPNPNRMIRQVQLTTVNKPSSINLYNFKPFHK